MILNFTVHAEQIFENRNFIFIFASDPITPRHFFLLHTDDDMMLSADEDSELFDPDIFDQEADHPSSLVGCKSDVRLPYTLRIPVPADSRICQVACDREGHDYATFTSTSM